MVFFLNWWISGCDTHLPSTPHEPQLIGTQVSSSATSSTPETAATKQKWCYCNGEESGKMIDCENDNCSVQWFHVECLRIKHKHGIVLSVGRGKNQLKRVYN